MIGTWPRDNIQPAVKRGPLLAIDASALVACQKKVDATHAQHNAGMPRSCHITIIGGRGHHNYRGHVGDVVWDITIVYPQHDELLRYQCMLDVSFSLCVHVCIARLQLDEDRMRCEEHVAEVRAMARDQDVE